MGFKVEFEADFEHRFRPGGRPPRELTEDEKELDVINSNAYASGETVKLESDASEEAVATLEGAIRKSVERLGFGQDFGAYKPHKTKGKVWVTYRVRDRRKLTRKPKTPAPEVEFSEA